MTVNEALVIIEAYHKRVNDSPTTIGKEDAWIIQAGKLCEAYISGKRKRLVTDATVDREARYVPIGAGIPI